MTAMVILQLNFAKYEKAGRFSYRMLPPGKVQVPGFSNEDTYKDVLMKGAKGLGISARCDNISLLVSNGLVRDAPLPSGQSWTLGNYIAEFGGVQSRVKRTFGILMLIDEEEMGTEDEEVYTGEVTNYNYFVCRSFQQDRWQ